MTKPTVKPSWLSALNKEQPLAPTAEVLQEPASMEVGEDESVAALPKYETPPPLDLTPKQAIGRGTREPLTEPTSSTMLPFPFDAIAFGRHTIITNDILDDGSMFEFKTASTGTIYNGEFLPDNVDELPNVVSGQRAIKPWDVIGLAEQVTQTARQALGELIEQLPEDYKQELLNKPTDSIFQQEFNGLDPVCKTCNGTGMIRRSIRHDESDIEEWDDDCPDCVGEDPLKIKAPKGLEPGSYTCQLNDKLEMVNVMPFMPNNEALLPEPKIGLEGREVLSSETWLGLMTPTESIAFDNHIALVMQSNSIHAAHLIRLKGFKSKYLQAIITTPEMAEEHIRVAIVRGEEPGGWDNSDHRRIKQAQELIARGFEVKAKQEARQRHALYVQRTREAWKQAVQDRKSALELLDIDVANKKETFQLARDMSFNEYMARFESGE